MLDVDVVAVVEVLLTQNPHVRGQNSTINSKAVL
jgi:hypothetical protein